MKYTELQSQIRELSPVDFDQMVGWILGTEQDRRREKDAMEIARSQVILEMVENGTLEGPKATTLSRAVIGEEIPEWVDPEGKFPSMYPAGSVVKKNGLVFASELTDRLNGYDPTAENGAWAWKDITETLKALNEPAPEPEPEDENVIVTSPWLAGAFLTKGELVEYFGLIYKVQKDHTAQAALPPDLPGLTTLYQPFEIGGDNQLGLEDRQSPPATGLEDLDPETDASA